MKIAYAIVIALVAAVLLWAGGALGSDLVVSYLPPTTNTDGSAIPASGPGSLTQHRVEYGSCVGAAFGTKVGEVIAPAPATSATITGLAPALWCARVFAKNTYGNESVASAVATKTIVAPTPNAPVVTTMTVAWAVRRNGTLDRVGRIDLGVQCGELVVAPNYYSVPKSAVRLYERLRDRPLVARCGV